MREVELMTPEDVARRLSVTRPTVYRWIKECGLKAIKVGRSYRVRCIDLDQWIAQQNEEV